MRNVPLVRTRAVAPLLAATAATLAAATPSFAQERCPGSRWARGGHGVSGSTTNGLDVSYVRESRGGVRDSVHLVAALITRGQPEWEVARDEAAAARARARMDSASTVARAGGRTYGGTFGVRGSAWVEYDPCTGVIYTHGKQFPRAGGDSTLVLLVDRTDGVGGPPVVTRLAVSSPWRPDVDLTPEMRAAGADRADVHEAIVRHFDALTAGWGRDLRADPRVSAFLGPVGPER